MDDGSVSVLSGDQEANSSNKKGNWVTFPFIIGAMAGLSLASGGLISNLIVYLMKEFNVKSIDAAQIFNVINGCSSLFPLVGAIISDSFLGSFSVIVISSCISLLGMLLVVLTSILDSLRPNPCDNLGSRSCQTPSNLQLAVLYGSITLATIGFGGTRFTIGTMGANQFDSLKDQGSFFNWFFFTLYLCTVISVAGIVYIQDNVSWGLGFGISFGATLIGLIVFLLGWLFYLKDRPQGSPFSSLARVVVASIHKRKLELSPRIEDYCYSYKESTTIKLNEKFRFFNRAALKTEGDMKPDGSIAKPWRLCTIQQVEDFKTLIKISPLWSSSIFLGTPIGIQASLTILQALTTDRHLGQHFQFPPSSILVVALISSAIFLTLIDRCLLPIWHKLTGQSPTPLQRIGLGHVLNVVGMVMSALVESKRLKTLHENNSTLPLSVLWLFPQLVLVGIGEAFHFPGQVLLYYQEFPVALRSTATAMVSLIIGISFYLSTALIDFMRRVTDWLPDDINGGRIDNVYWVLVVVGVVNFGYYLCCASCTSTKTLKKVVLIRARSKLECIYCTPIFHRNLNKSNPFVMYTRM